MLTADRERILEGPRGWREANGRNVLDSCVKANESRSVMPKTALGFKALKILYVK